MVAIERSNERRRWDKLRLVSGRRTKSGLIQAMMSFDPAHLQALRAEALRRAVAAGSGKPDASAVLREILDAWVKRAGKR